MRNTIDNHVEKIVSASKEEIFYINFEEESIRDSQKYPVIGSVSELGGFTSKMSKELMDVLIFMAEKKPQRISEDTDVSYRNRLNEKKQEMKDYISEIIDILIGDDFDLPYDLGDEDVLFDENEDEDDDFIIVKADMTIIKNSKIRLKRSLFNEDALNDLFNC